MLPHPTTRFTDRAADYAQSRPRYPDALVHLLVAELALRPDAQIADIGSGTGLSAEPFLRHGFRVIGVEPNAAMRAVAERTLASYDAFRSVDGTAEATGLDDLSVDLVLVAQAFHWFDVERARVEIMRILRPDGGLCLAWNTRRRSGSPFLEAYEELLRRYGTDYEQVERRTRRITGGDEIAYDVLRGVFGGPWERRVLKNCQELDFDGLVRRVRSSSYMPSDGSPLYAGMIAALGDLFAAEAHGGTVELTYDLDVYYGRPDRS